MLIIFQLGAAIRLVGAVRKQCDGSRSFQTL